VDGGVTIGDVQTPPDPESATQTVIASAQTASPTVDVTAPAGSSVASIPETDVTLMPQETPNGAEAPPIRLAALSWETRGIIGINAITVDRLRVEGNAITPDSEENRSLLAAIDPKLLQDQSDTEALDPTQLATLAQTELRRLGCYKLGIDGDWGNGSRTALTSYFLAKRTVPDSLEPTEALVRQLSRDTNVVCAVRVSRVAPAVRARAQATVKATQVSETGGARKVNPVTKRVINPPAKVQKELGKSLLGSGSF
jgi:hypothetical protein